MGDNLHFEEAVTLALSGDREAKFSLGHSYYCGKFGDYVFEKDLEKSTAYFKEAADLGHSAAQNNFAVASFYGVGTPKNITIAKEYFEKAVNSGSITAQYNLANLMRLGLEGQEPDEKKALELYSYAADCGLPHAQYALGCAYGTGMGITKDKRLSTMWLQIAAEQDYGPAQTRLARTFVRGNKHTNGPNLKKAALWSTMAEKNKLFPMDTVSPKHKMNITEMYDETISMSDIQADCAMEYDDGNSPRFISDERKLLKLIEEEE